MKNLEKLSNAKFEGFELKNQSNILGGGTSIFKDVNPTKRKWDGDRNKTSWNCDSTERCSDVGEQ